MHTPIKANKAQGNVKRFFLAGPPGSGKTMQILTLPGPVLVYVFDPNALETLRQTRREDIDILDFRTDLSEIDLNIRGLRKGSKNVTVDKTAIPKAYSNFCEDIDERLENGSLYKDYKYVCFDSFTFIARAAQNQLNYIQNRIGELEDLGDYRIVGSAISTAFSALANAPIGLLATAHFQDREISIGNPLKPDTVQRLRIETQLNLPGQSRNVIPAIFTDVWETTFDKGEYRFIRQHHERTKFHRSTMGQDTVVATVNLNDPENSGIGALLKKESKK